MGPFFSKVTQSRDIAYRCHQHARSIKGTNNDGLSKMKRSLVRSSDVEAEAEALEAVDLWWKRKRLKICRFPFRSVSKLLFKFW
jgi:hypothetical protein